MNYKSSILELLALNRQLNLLLEDVIEPTLDSITRLIDVLTGVGGQLRESSLGVVSRMVNNKKNLNIRELSVTIFNIKDKISELEKRIDRETNGEENARIDEDIKRLSGQMHNAMKSREQIRLGLYSLSAQNLLFKMAFGRMNEIVAKYGFKGTPVDVGELPAEFGDDTAVGAPGGDPAGSGYQVATTVPIEQQLRKIFQRMAAEWKQTIAGVESMYFRNQTRPGASSVYLGDFLQSGVLWLRNIQDTLLESKDQARMKDFAEKFGNLNFSFTVEKDDAEVEAFKHDWVENKKQSVDPKELLKYYIIEKLSDGFYKKTFNLNRYMTNTTISADNVSAIIGMLKQIPLHVLGEVADESSPRGFAEFGLNKNLQDTIVEAVKIYKKKYPQASNPEKELAGLLYISKIGIKKAGDDDGVLQVPEIGENEQWRLEKVKSIVDTIQQTAELEAIKTVVVSPENTQEFNAVATQIIDQKKQEVAPNFTIEQVAQIVVNHGGTITEEDIENAQTALGLEDVTDVQEPLLLAIQDIAKYSGQDFSNLVNLLNNKINIVWRKQQVQGVPDAVQEPVRTMHPIPVNNIREIKQGLINLFDESEKISGFFKNRSRETPAIRWRGLISDKTWEKVDMKKYHDLLVDFERKTEESLGILASFDEEALIKLFNIWHEV